ncbi:hypothetical protein ABW16_01925 [Mycolicibacter heraklionensis]|uniref:Uncharacterized protein n=2 Tax=Mycolicibacter heraklionensis TaxID=512402 RepID=A0ABR5FLM0_9MYCO|nr:hypothetical protein ABW16_01925 [Mycolicibacter heraklionensis]
MLTPSAALLIDYAPTRNIDRVADDAVEIAEKIRRVDHYQLYGELVELCAMHPAKGAQLLMAFAAWFDLDMTMVDLQIRAEQTAAEAQSRTKR